MASTNKRMACALALMMIGIYSWVTREDAVAVSSAAHDAALWPLCVRWPPVVSAHSALLCSGANDCVALQTQYSSCGRLGQQSPAQRTLVLHPREVLGGGVAESLSRAGHRVFVLLDPSERGSAAHAQLVSQYLRAELEPVYWRGGSNNVSSLLELVDQHAISMVVDTRPLLLSTQPNRLALAQRLADMKTPGGKRTYIYTSGCTMHSLDVEVPAVEDASSAVVPAGALAADFPPHVAMSPEHFEAELRDIGSRSKSNLNTILLRPGLLFGAAAWATSPLRSWVRGVSGSGSGSGSAERNAEVASLPFLGLHLNDLLGAFVAVCGASASSLNALSGDVYDLHDDTRISHAEVQKLFVKIAAAEGQRHAAATQPSAAAEEESNLAAVAGVEKDAATAGAGAGAVTTPKPSRAARKLAALSSGGGSAAADAAAGASDSAAAGTGSLPSEWLNRPRCPASKRGAGTFQTITRWKPAHKKINDPAMMHTYVQAIKHTTTLRAQDKAQATTAV